MSDVTFGVKVPEEMKSELSELMKTSDLSGKEFMQMLLMTYKLEQTKRSHPMVESDLNELQFLLQRIQNIYFNLTEKTETVVRQQIEEIKEASESVQEENENLKKQVEQHVEALREEEEAFKKASKNIETLEAAHTQLIEEAKEQKNQIKNNQLLHSKFESEIEQLELKIEDFKRLALEIEERNEENNKLKNRNDELASEIWFLKREVEKITQEKKYHQEKYEEEKKQLEFSHALALKNSLLEQRLRDHEKIEFLKEENLKLQKEFSAKLEELYKVSKNSKPLEVPSTEENEL